MKILVVEDEKYIREGIVSIVRTHVDLPCKIESAADGLSALALCREFLPDLVITDIVMPDITGLELIRRLRQERSAASFVILSGHDDFAFAQQAIRYGVVDYLLKPLDPQQLLLAVRRVYDELPDRRRASLSCDFAEFEFLRWQPDEEAMPSSLKKIWLYIQKNYMKDLSLQSISEELFFHPAYISSLINKYTGHSFTFLLDYVRLRKAAEYLLSRPDLSIAELGHMVGYYNERRLYAAFQKRLNTTPGDFRRMYEER